MAPEVPFEGVSGGRIPPSLAIALCTSITSTVVRCGPEQLRRQEENAEADDISGKQRLQAFVTS